MGTIKTKLDDMQQKSKLSKALSPDSVLEALSELNECIRECCDQLVLALTSEVFSMISQNLTLTEQIHMRVLASPVRSEWSQAAKVEVTLTEEYNEAAAPQESRQMAALVEHLIGTCSFVHTPNSAVFRGSHTT